MKAGGMRAFVLSLALTLAPAAGAGEAPALVDPAWKVAPDDPAWRELAARFARRPEGTAPFFERRVFPFRLVPIELQGESRVAPGRGLSLHYTAPAERIVILDAQGVLVRDARGETAAPDDPRAAAANAALVQVLRFDLAALAEHFELYGRREDESWQLAFVPRAGEVRRRVGIITVAGRADALERIEIRQSARQYVVIGLGPARVAPFSAAELQRYFR